MSSDPAVATRKRKRVAKKKETVPEVTVEAPKVEEVKGEESNPKPTKPVKHLSAKNKTKRLQKSTKPLFSRAPLDRYVHGRANEICQESSGLGATADKPGEVVGRPRICSDAIDLVQQGLEKYLSDSCNQAACVMKNRGKTTMTIHDIRVAKQVRDDELSKQILYELNTINPIIVKHKVTKVKSLKKRKPAAVKAAVVAAPLVTVQ